MALARHQFTVTDEAGNIIPGAHVEVRREIYGSPLAALKEDRDGFVSLSNPFDADSEGFAGFFVIGGAYRIRVYTGPSGAPVFEAPIHRYVAIGLNSESDTITQRTQRVITVAGGVVVGVNDADDIIIKKTVGAATSVSLPPAAGRTKPIRIVDGKGDANTNNITITPQTGETIFTVVNYPAVIDGNGGQMTFTPLEDGSGWY